MHRYRNDYEYIDMDEQYDGGPCKSIPIDEFRKYLDKQVEFAESKDGSNICVTVDTDRDIVLQYQRPETDKERAAREERERRRKQEQSERLLDEQEQKWKELRRLAEELNVEIPDHE